MAVNPITVAVNSLLMDGRGLSGFRRQPNAARGPNRCRKWAPARAAANASVTASRWPLSFCLLALALPAAAQWRTGYFMQHEAAGQTAATIPWSKYTHVIHSALRPTYSNEVCGLDTTEGL